MEHGNRGPLRVRGISATSLAVSLVVVVVLGLGALGLERSRAVSGEAPGEYRLVMTDYAFAPSHLSLPPGERVTLTIVNQSQSVPGKEHEFMLGQVPIVENSPFGLVPGDGFKLPLLVNAEVEVTEAQKVTMLMPGSTILTGSRLEELLVPVEGEMPGMEATPSPGPATPAPEPTMAPMPGMEGTPTQTMAPMPGMEMLTPTMAPMPGMEEMPMQAVPTATPAAMPGMSPMFVSRDLAGRATPPARAMDQFMAVLADGGVLQISFVVPDEPGVWEYGCFAQNGQHYLNGMGGTIEIVGRAGGGS